MARVFIIGDIHGCCKTFKKLVIEEIDLKKSDKIYCLGDYIDRGPDTKGVIDFILELRQKGHAIHTLRGNHEQMLLNSANDEHAFLHWTTNGGENTLASFQIDGIKKLKPQYLNFLRRTKFFIETKDFILVHAGLNFTLENPLADKDAMLWIRNFTVDKNYLKAKLLIHGHTPMRRAHILSQPLESPINLDGGCVYKNKTEYGSLFALNFYEKKLLEVKNVD